MGIPTKSTEFVEIGGRVRVLQVHENWWDAIQPPRDPSTPLGVGGGLGGCGLVYATDAWGRGLGGAPTPSPQTDATPRFSVPHVGAAGVLQYRALPENRSWGILAIHFRRTVNPFCEERSDDHILMTVTGRPERSDGAGFGRSRIYSRFD